MVLVCSLHMNMNEYIMLVVKYGLVFFFFFFSYITFFRRLGHSLIFLALCYFTLLQFRQWHTVLILGILIRHKNFTNIPSLDLHPPHFIHSHHWSHHQEVNHYDELHFSVRRGNSSYNTTQPQPPCTANTEPVLPVAAILMAVSKTAQSQGQHWPLFGYFGFNGQKVSPPNDFNHTLTFSQYDDVMMVACIHMHDDFDLPLSI